MPFIFPNLLISGPPYRPIAVAGPCLAINFRHCATVIKFFQLDASSPAAVRFCTDGTEHCMRRYISRPSSLVSGFKTSFETIVANELFPLHQTLWSYGWGGYLRTNFYVIYNYPYWVYAHNFISISFLEVDLGQKGSSHSPNA